MLRAYLIKWTRSENDADLSALGSTQVYMFRKDQELLYIGFSFEDDLEDAVDLDLQRLNLDSTDVEIWKGTVVENLHNYVDKKLLEEIRCLLINKLQPRFNSVCKDQYYGRSSLVIKNLDCSPLPRFMAAEENCLPQTA